MPNEINVRPARAGMALRHPVSGLLADEGGRWIEDQFTFRRLRDGDIERFEPSKAEPEPVKPAPELEKRDLVPTKPALPSATTAASGLGKPKDS